MAYKKTRCPNHDYRSRSIYMITLNKKEGVSDFSHVYGRRSDGNLISGVRYNDNGRIISEALRNVPLNFPEVRIEHYKIMPDHIHFIINVTVPTSYHLGKVISKLTAECNGACPSEGIFETGYHDRILRRKGQLQILINYIDDNPRRWFIRVKYPEYFNNPHLLNLWGQDYILYGNFQLLRNPAISAVKVSRSHSEAEKAILKSQWREVVRSNGVLISPFISPDEEEMLEFALANEGKIILITRWEIRGRFKPSERLMAPCANGRLLIISTQKGAVIPKLKKPEAEEMNSLAKRIATEPLPELKLRKMDFGKTGHASSLTRANNESSASAERSPVPHSESKTGRRPLSSPVPSRARGK